MHPTIVQPVMRMFLLPSVVLPYLISAQVALTFDPSVPVTRGGDVLSMAWGGGLNAPQVSTVDLNGDGLKDLFLFDRSGDKSVMLLNDGEPGQASYTLTHAYDHLYPFDRLQQWALLRDYNGDGKEDIFTYSIAGFAVYKNTSEGTIPSFVEVDTLVRSNYVPTDANLYISQVDIPGIEDIDGDGDLDVITFSILGSYMEYHRNLSMELYGVPDSLEYEVHNRCWGFFSENLASNIMTLDDPCDFNVPNPELPIQIGAATAVLKATHQMSHRPGEDPGSERAHTGSTSLPIDLDGDGDKDLLLGDVMYKNLIALYNGGSADTAHMTSQDTLFPSYDVPVQLPVFPAAFYVDVDNDGRRDLIVTPNYLSASENQRSVWYYHNTGTDQVPLFNKISEDLFQGRMLDLGEGAYPVPFDFDGDGLMDILVSNYGYYQENDTFPCKIAVLRNTGTATAPAFTQVQDDYMGFGSLGYGSSLHPAFGDLDGDGDQDLIIGDLQGRLHRFRNDPVGGAAQFVLVEQQVMNDNATIIDVGQFATPQLFDVDADGLLDLLIGERNGNLDYYRNSGSAGSPAWHLENDSVGNVVVAEWWNVTGYSVPFMYLNNEGQRELLVGSESGWIHHYDNIDGNVNGTWNQVDSTWQDIREGANTSVMLHDFNNDGYKDAVIGNYRGGISYWRNDFNAGVQAEDRLEGRAAFSLMPNPAGSETDLLLEIPMVKDTRLEILDGVGQVLLGRPLRDRRSTLDLSGFAPGVYLVRVSDGTRSWTQRMTVVR